MNCEEVQPQLLEYLDRSLDTITTKHLDLHLTSCPPCRAEADSLADCIQQVAALPIVDPPLGFAQRVMAHAREIERRPSIWQRLALPLHRSTPIPAIAVVLIAIFSAYLYQKEPPVPLERFAKGNTAQPIALPDQREETQRKAQTDNTAPVVADRATPSRRESQPKTAATDDPPAGVTSNATPAETPKAESENRALAPSQAPKRPPIQVQEVATGREGSRVSRESFRLGDFPLAAPRQPPLRSTAPAEGPLFSMNEPVADIEFVVRRRSPQRRDQAERENTEATRTSAEADAGASGTLARRAAPSLSGMIVETRWFTVAHEHLEQFKKDLAAETVVESESVDAKREKELAAKTERPLAIKVIIIPATDR
jgi:Putative zinc-finger